MITNFLSGKGKYIKLSKGKKKINQYKIFSNNKIKYKPPKFEREVYTYLQVEIKRNNNEIKEIYINWVSHILCLRMNVKIQKLLFELPLST